MSKFDLAKKFFKEKMYNNKNVIKTNHGKKTPFFILKTTQKNILTRKLKKTKLKDSCDFITGMTDRYAIKLYKSIK